jgi:hypothetical protein
MSYAGTAYPLLRPRAVEELWFAEHGDGDLIALREKELQKRVSGTPPLSSTYLIS